MRYIAELERKVQTLQTEATSLSAQLTLLQVNFVAFLAVLVQLFLLLFFPMNLIIFLIFLPVEQKVILFQLVFSFIWKGWCFWWGRLRLVD